MTEDVRVISTMDTLLRCADTLLMERVRRLPVTRSDGKVVGIVYLRDVYNVLTGLLTH
jgi:CBS domain-containing protein